MTQSIKKLSKSEAGRLGWQASKHKIHDKQKYQASEKRKLYDKNPIICALDKCDNVLTYIQASDYGQYCSRSCARQSGKTGRQAELSICAHPTCDNQVKTYKGKYCSRNCYDNDKSLKADLKVESGLGSANNVKKYLLKHNGDICMDPTCAWDLDQKFVKCELEHIDGNSTNNILKNCILLCPNCHSLTPTYKSRNKGKGRWKRRKRYSEGKSY